MLSGQTMATRLGDLGKWDALFQVDEKKALIFHYGSKSRELTDVFKLGEVGKNSSGEKTYRCFQVAWSI